MPEERPSPAIRLATKADIPALMALNSPFGFPEVAHVVASEGFLSMLLPVDWFDDAIDDAGIHLDLAEVTEFSGTPIAQQRFAFRGPVLVDESARGMGVYSAFNAAMRQAYGDRFDVGVLFVSADNPRSLHTTTTKLGARPLADFEVAGKKYVLLAFEFSA